jgi:hypothetical protein
METVKQTKNTIKIGGVTYGSATYLKNANKTFNKDKFVVIKNISYYLPI